MIRYFPSTFGYVSVKPAFAYLETRVHCVPNVVETLRIFTRIHEFFTKITDLCFYLSFHAVLVHRDWSSAISRRRIFRLTSHSPLQSRLLLFFSDIYSQFILDSKVVQCNRMFPRLNVGHINFLWATDNSLVSCRNTLTRALLLRR